MLTTAAQHPAVSFRTPAIIALSLVISIALAVASIPWNGAQRPAVAETQPAPSPVQAAPSAVAGPSQPGTEFARPQPAPVPTPAPATPALTAPQYSQSLPQLMQPPIRFEGVALLSLAAAALCAGAWLALRRPVFVR